LPAQFTIGKFPKDNALVARDLLTNQGVVAFDLKINKSLSHDSILWKKYEDGQLIFSKEISAQILKDSFQYRFSDTLSAGLHLYTYEIWYGKNVLIKKASNICCGDFYIIDGQSNAESRMREESCAADYSPYIRTYGHASERGNTHEWTIATGDGNRDSVGHIGQLGVALAYNIVTKNKIPVCIFNGAVGGREIIYFQKDNVNIQNPQTAYGRLFTRIKEAEALQNIRALVWYQGENDAYKNTPYSDYFASLQSLYTAWMNDYKHLENIYIVQIKQGCNQKIESTVAIQQAQLDFDRSHKEVYLITTTEMKHYGDNCHFNYYSGYKLLGNKLYGLMQHLQYGAAENSKIENSTNR
jgi:hypothetical protein